MRQPISQQRPIMAGLDSIKGPSIPSSLDEDICKLRRTISKLREDFSELKPGRELRRTKNLIKTYEGRLQKLENGDFGRTIPEELINTVQRRDHGRDFHRPNHQCEKPGHPHHIIHFSDFKGPHTSENPHTILNLECPCNDCHKLAHSMGIRSGISIGDFFNQFSADEWKTIEDHWANKRTSLLKTFIAGRTQ